MTLRCRNRRRQKMWGTGLRAIPLSPARTNTPSNTSPSANSSLRLSWRSLLEFRLAKESGRQPWTAVELITAARLFERAPDANEAARLYFALYSLPGASDRSVEDALAGLANLLLSSPEETIRFGSGDL